MDRLISGAGAVSASVDRFVRSVMPGGTMAHQPASLLVAALLVALALVFVMVGLESAGSPTPQALDPVAVARGDDLGNRVHASMVGRVPSTYVETFADDDLDGVQDAGELGQAWNYFLLGLTADSGVLVRSPQPPSAVYAYQVSGTLVEDRAYVAEDLGLLGDDLSIPGLLVDPQTYLIANGVDAGTPHDLAQDLPAPGTTIALDASRTIEYLTACSVDTDGDGVCADDEVDIYDLVVYDPASRRAVVVVTDVSPEYQVTTFRGILRRDARAVADAISTPGMSLAEMGIEVSQVYVLDEGSTPADSPALYGLAALALALAGTVALGVAGGYVRFRAGASLPAGARTMAPGERVPLRVTGVLRGPAGPLHVREAPADLVRFVLDPGVPEPRPSTASATDPATTLIVERHGRPEGVAVGGSELAGILGGSVVLGRGPRPAVRLVAGTGPLLLSFESVTARDRAAAELIAEAGSTVAHSTPAAEDT